MYSGSSLLFGVFIENALTISCPAGCISTLYSDKIFDDLKTYNIRNVIVLAGTNNIFDKNDRPLMLPLCGTGSTDSIRGTQEIQIQTRFC